MLKRVLYNSVDKFTTIHLGIGVALSKSKG
jgi:hypothetical protein